METNNRTCNCNNCNDTTKKGSYLMTGVVAGIVLGGVLAYVYASPDGKKKAKKFLEESSDILKEFTDRAADMGITAENLGTKAVEIKDAVTEQVELAQEDTKKNGLSLAQNLQKRFFKKKSKKLN